MIYLGEKKWLRIEMILLHFAFQLEKKWNKFIKQRHKYGNMRKSADLLKICNFSGIW